MRYAIFGWGAGGGGQSSGRLHDTSWYIVFVAHTIANYLEKETDQAWLVFQAIISYHTTTHASTLSRDSLCSARRAFLSYRLAQLIHVNIKVPSTSYYTEDIYST